MYKVVNLFMDIQDNNCLYHPGDEFPRAGLEVSEERKKELSSSNNRQGRPLIVWEEPKKPGRRKGVTTDDDGDMRANK